MWATCTHLASSGYHAEFHEDCYQKLTSPLNSRTSSSDISSYHADFHKGHGSVREWQECGMACVNLCSTAWQGDSMGMAWAQHGMCELGLRGHFNFHESIRKAQ
jgi:hypothetical protein